MDREIFDLRSAIAVLKEIQGEYIETSRSVNLKGELTGIYKKMGARGTVKRPTSLGPMILFNNIDGYPDARIAIGVLGSRQRIGFLLNSSANKLGSVLNDAVKNAISPIEVPNGDALCQEEIHLATDSNFDIRKLLAVPFTTVKDAGPYITMGLCCSSDPDNKENKHRKLQVQVGHSAE